MMRNTKQNGFILMPVVVAIVLVATVAFMLNNQSAINANTQSAENQGEQARYVAEAGFNHALWLSNNSNCAGYQGSLVENLGIHTYTASVSPASGSPVTITANGTLQNGSSRNLTRNAVRIFQPSSILSLQPDPTDAKDTHIYQWKPAWNFGVDPNLVVTASSDSSEHSLLQFDLSAIPAGVKILSANLELHSNSNAWSITTIDVHRVTNTWLEGDANGGAGAGANWTEADAGNSWSAAGGDFDPAISASAITPGGMGWINWDVATLVSDWVNGTAVNYGLMLRTTELYKGAQFDSSDANNATNRPKLTITYACECGAGGTPGTLLLEPGPGGRDSTILGEAGKTSDNYGNLDTLITSSLTGKEERALVYFDLSALPAGVIIQNAKLGLYLDSFGTSDLVEIYRLSRDWDESGVTWDSYDGTNNWTTPGGDFAATPSGSFVADSVGQKTAEIGSLVQAWVDGSEANYGMLLLSPSNPGGSQNKYHSGDKVGVPVPRLSINYNCPCGVDCTGVGSGASTVSLWVATQDNVTSSGAPGLDNWTDGEILEFKDPDLVLEPGVTNGTFSSIVNLDSFANDGNAEINGLHYVDSDITVGSANSVTLQPGDLLITTAQDETLTSNNTLAVTRKDVFVFRPATAGDYSAGAFIFLLDGAQLHSEADTRAISLVEKETNVDGTFLGTLSAGTFLFNTSNRRDVQTFVANDVGAGTTSGNVGEFVDGPDVNLGSEIRGIDLAEDEITLGGHIIPAGSILLTLNNDGSNSGDNGVPTDSEDIFYLTMTQTGSTSAGDATLLFEGLDVNLDTTAEHLQALTLTNSVTGGGGGSTAPVFDVLLVVGNLTLSSKDVGYKALMESWGYTVTLIDDGDSQANYNTAMAAVDVVYASGSALGANMLDKATFTTKGVVNEVPGKIDNFGFSSIKTGTANFDAFSSTDAAHYITQPFSGSAVTVFNSSLTNPVPSGTLAPDLSNVAAVSGALAIGTLDTGATRYDSSPSQGRRVHLPYAEAESADMTDDGKTILQRAIEWAAGSGSGGGGSGGGEPPPASDNVVFEAYNEAKRSSNGKSLNIPAPAGTASGDLLIAALVTDGKQQNPMSPPAGWTLINHGVYDEKVTLDVWWKLAGTSEPAQYPFTWGEDQEAYGWIMRFTGHDPVNPINVSASTGGISSSPTSPAVTTTVSDAMILRIGGFDDDDISVDDPGLSGHTAITMDESGSGNGTASGGAGYKTQAAAGDSGTSTFSLTKSEQYRTVTIGIAPTP